MNILSDFADMVEEVKVLSLSSQRDRLGDIKDIEKPRTIKALIDIGKSSRKSYNGEFARRYDLLVICKDDISEKDKFSIKGNRYKIVRKNDYRGHFEYEVVRE